MISSNDYCSFFPYSSYREGQEEMIKEINKKLEQKGHFLLIAPNGTGKSSISLSSALPIAFENDLKVIYLCRTHQQTDRIVKELKQIKKKCFDLNAIALRGRYNLCINEELRKKDLSFEELMSQCSQLRNKEIKNLKDLNGKPIMSGCKYYTKFKFFIEEQDNIKLRKTQDVGYFETLKTSVVDTREILNECKDREICPYYFIRHLLKWMKVVVCNYNWVFHEKIRNLVLLPELNKFLSECIVIVDECHNLPEVVLDINQLDLSDIISLQSSLMLEQLRNTNIELSYLMVIEEFIKPTINFLLKTKSEFEKDFKSKKNEYPIIKEINPIKLLNNLLKRSKSLDINKLRQLLTDLRFYSKELYYDPFTHLKEKFKINWLELFTNFWINWIKCSKEVDLADKHFFGIHFSKEKDQFKLSLYLRPLDPREYIKPVLENAYATLHVSGTLISEVYSNLTSLIEFEENFEEKQVKSTFPKENIRAIVINDLNSRYIERNKEMFQKINSCIGEILKIRKGNIAIFTVSYNFLKKLTTKKLGKKNLKSIIRNLNRPLFREKKENSSSKNSLLIKDFKSSENAVLLGVLGGRNCEGEDFPGKEMESVIIVGFPFPPPSDELAKKQRYYNKIFPGKGELYAKIEPSIRKANQAAGRPIRKLKDRGMIFFLDERYANYYNHRHLSDWLVQEGVFHKTPFQSINFKRLLTDF